MWIRLIPAAAAVLTLIALLQPVDSLANETLPAQERLKSCNPTVALAAAKEIVSAPETFKHPGAVLRL